MSLCKLRMLQWPRTFMTKKISLGRSLTNSRDWSLFLNICFHSLCSLLLLHFSAHCTAHSLSLNAYFSCTSPPTQFSKCHFFSTALLTVQLTSTLNRCSSLFSHCSPLLLHSAHSHSECPLLLHICAMHQAPQKL